MFKTKHYGLDFITSKKISSLLNAEETLDLYPAENQISENYNHCVLISSWPSCCERFVCVFAPRPTMEPDLSSKD